VHANTTQPAQCPCPPTLPALPPAPCHRHLWLASTSDALVPPSRLRSDVPPPPLLPPSASESLHCCHAASRRRDAVKDLSRIPPARRRVYLALPQAFTETVTQHRRADAAAAQTKLSRRTAPGRSMRHAPASAPGPTRGSLAGSGSSIVRVARAAPAAHV
jgi:hypothetical protein